MPDERLVERRAPEEEQAGEKQQDHHHLPDLDSDVAAEEGDELAGPGHVEIGNQRGKPHAVKETEDERQRPLPIRQQGPQRMECGGGDRDRNGGLHQFRRRRREPSHPGQRERDGMGKREERGDLQGDTEASPPRYVIYLEREPGRGGEPVDQSDLASWAADFDELLSQANPAVVEYREGGYLGPPRLAIVEPGALVDLVVEGDRAPSRSQLKTPRRVDRPDQIALLEPKVMATT